MHGQYSKRLLVRTWNLFHGNTKPPGRRAYLEQLVRLAAEDEPDILCLQELSVWALVDLPDWSGMTAVTDVARRPLPLLGELARTLSGLDARRFRSAITGEANAVLLKRSLTVVEHRRLVLNPFRFRRLQARQLRLPLGERIRWASERRVLQALRVRGADGTFLVANAHITGHKDKRIPDAELLRAAVFVDGFAQPGEPVLLCGDFNLTVGNSRTLGDLMTPQWGFSGATPNGIDHILVRGLRAQPPLVWPVERRTREGRILSDHAPVDVEVE
ncbi:MAG TPA: endonuclease/exonuclease/phosphatase family protein [Gaiellaceae bacterium]|nr:endonuclease/exonuclease/phosphatase family protein [Gaiellaceae bacterium]